MHFVRIKYLTLLVFALLSYISCNKDSSPSPTISYLVDGKQVKGRSKYDVYAEYNSQYKNLLIVGENEYHANYDNGDTIYLLNFVINNVNNPKDIVGIEISSINTPNNTISNYFVYGDFMYFYENDNNENNYYLLDDFTIKVNSIKDNKISGVFNGIVKSNHDFSMHHITSGTFKDLPLESIND